MTFEDFTTYTEVDPDSDITVAANQLTIDTLRRDAVTYVRDDKGAGHFGNFEHLLQTKITFADTRSCSINWAITNGSNTLFECRTNTEGLVVFPYTTAGGDYKIYMEECAEVDQDIFSAALNTDYYLTIERSGTTLTCKIYSDAARTTLLDTLSLTVAATTYRYVFGAASMEYNATYGGQELSSITKDLDLQEAVPTVGGIMHLQKYWGDI